MAKQLQRPVLMPGPNGSFVSFAPDHYEMREGFSVDEATGQIIVSDDPNELSYHWHGRNGRDHLAITVRRGTVAARLHSPTGVHTIQREGREHQFRMIDPALLNRGSCRGPISPRQLAALAPRSTTTMPSGKSSTRPSRTAHAGKAHGPKYSVHIDVLFYYTDRAALLLDPTYDPTTNPGPALSMLQTRAQQYVDEVNQTLQNSGMTRHIRFHQAGPVTRLMWYNEPNIAFDESAFAAQPPGARFAMYIENTRLADIASASPQPPNRATYAADIAVLMVADMGDPAATPPSPLFGAATWQNGRCDLPGVYCGIGVQYGQFAFGAVSIAEETARFTFSHEIGHMLGAEHDYFPGATTTYPHLQQEFSHSYGYRILPSNPPGTRGARDVMADPWCGASWNPDVDLCPRAQLYSNPEVYFPGLIGGLQVPAGTTGGRFCWNPRPPDPDPPPPAPPSPPGNCPPTAMAARTVMMLAQGTSDISTGIATEMPFFWDSLEEFCDAPICPTW